MTKLATLLAATALATVPLAAHAQDREGYRGSGHVSRAPAAAAHGYDASARVRGAYDRRGVAYRGRSYGYGYGGGRGYDAYGRGGAGFRGGVTLGVGYGGYYGYGGYPYGGYYDTGAYPVDGYGADLAYSYPDTNGAYQPFAYDYSPPDDAYYAAGQGYGDDADAYGGDAGGYDDGAGGYAGAGANDGWSVGGPPADCGRWIWRSDRGAYEWAAAPCPYPR
jgi:hypothetical protein